MPTLVSTGQFTIVDVNDGPISNLTPPSELTSVATTPMGGWTTYSGTLSNSSIVNDQVGPNGEYPRILRISGDGTIVGWYHGYKYWFKVDITKAYVTYCWIRKRTANSANLYLGWTNGANYIDNLAGGNDTNPYFISAQNPTTADKWYLCVGVIWPSGYGSGDTGLAGMYDPYTGVRVHDGNEWRHNTAATQQYFRFGYYNNVTAQAATDGFDFIPVGTYCMDGTHPTKEAIMNTVSAAMTAGLSKETYVFPANNDGSVSSYVGSGTQIRVYQGAAELTYDGVGTAKGTWRIASTTPTNITVGSIADSGTFATVADHSAVAAGTDTSTIVYNIAGKTLTGADFTLVNTQTFAKAKAGTNGTRTAVLEMYQWATSAPSSFPSGTSTYTWSTGTFTAPATANSWTLTPGTPSAGQTLYVVRQVYSDSLTASTSSVTWAATSSLPSGAAGTNGTNGTNGQRVGVLEVYQWSATSPTTYPSGTSTYTWATGAFTAPTTPNGWTLLPGAAVSGQTLWGISVSVSDNLTSSTSSATWNSTTPYVVGYAGASFTGNLRTLGSFTTLYGNSSYKSGGTHGVVEGGIVGPRFTGAAYISSSSPNATLGGGWQNFIALDNDDTTFALASQQYSATFVSSGATTGTLQLLKDGSVLSSISITGASASWRLLLTYDGVKVTVYYGTFSASTYSGVSSGMSFYPKVLDFFNNTSSSPTVDIMYGSWSDNSWASVGGVDRPENNATVSDNRIRNADMSNTTTDTWWGTLTRTTGVAANNDPAFFARTTTGAGQGGYINNGVNAPCVAGERMYCNALIRAQTVASNNAIRFNPFFWKADGSFLSQIIAEVPATSTSFTVVKSVFEVPAGAATFTLLIAVLNNTGTYTDIAMPRIGYTEFSADVTSTAQVTCELLSDKTVAADYTGAITSTNLSALLWAPVVVKGGASVKIADGTTYAISNVYGVTGGTGFVLDNTTSSTTKGNITIAAGSTLSDVSGGDLVITVGGVAQPKIAFRLTKDKSAPPTGGGGGAPNVVSWSDGDMISITGTSYQSIVTPVKTLAIASTSETISVLLDLSFDLSGTTAGSATETVKVQYAVASSGSWNDFPAGSVTSTSSTSGYYAGGYDWIEGNPGGIFTTHTKSGLSAGSYDIRVIGLTSTTTRYMTPRGTIYGSVA